MATLVLTAVGTAVGGPIGGAIGAIVGQTVDGALFAPKAREGPRLGELAVQTSSYGSAIPKLFGTMRVAGTVIWSTDLLERRSTSGGGKGRPKTVDYSYSASFAVALSGRPVCEVLRIWADGKLLRGAGGDFKSKTRFRLYSGDEDQEVDPLIAAAEGAGQAPAFRGTAYAMFEEMELADFGNRIPSLSFEVVADDGAVAIGAVAAELSAGGVTAGPTPELLGYAASGSNVRGAVEELAELTGLSLIDDGAVLSIAAPAGAPEVLARSRESGRRELVRRAAASVPGEVSVAYYDVTRDFQTGLQRASAGAPTAEARSERRGLAAALSADMAKAFAERRLDSLWAGRASATVKCGWSAAAVRPGMRVRLEGEAGIWRVERWTLGDMDVKLELVRTSDAVVGPLEASPGRPVSEADQPHGPTLIRLLDLPIADGSERPTLIVLAGGTQAGWRRAEMSVSFDGGASWSDIGSTPPPAAIGATLTALGPGGSALLDDLASVEVELANESMELLARDDDALVGGANLAVIGDELVQFGRAEPVAPGRYRLSRLLRGRRGTEWAAGDHQAGEPFALIEAGSVGTIELPPGTDGGEVRLLASGVGDAEPVEARLVARGEKLRPPSPVHLRSEPMPGGDRKIRWVRRSRLGWSWASDGDTPLGEESEAYRVTLSGTGFVRSVETGVDEYLYTAAERAADGTGPVQIEVVQLGTHGPSRPAVITIS